MRRPGQAPPPEPFGVPTPRASRELLDLLHKRSCPGNVRELRNTIESLMALSPNGALDLSVLGDASRTANSGGASLEEKLRACERGVLVDSLSACRQRNGSA